MRFIVEGPPVGKERPRKGRGRHFYTPEKTTRFESAVAMAFLKVARRRLEPPAISVHVRCFFKNRAHPDPDNVLKAVLDALTGMAYPHDRYLGSSVTCEYDAARPRIEVEVE